MEISFELKELKQVGNGKHRLYELRVLHNDEYKLPILKGYKKVSEDHYFIKELSHIPALQVLNEFKELYKYHMGMYSHLYKK